MDGTYELDAWEFQRCQIASCDCNTNPIADCQRDLDTLSVQTLDTVHLREIEEIEKEVNLDAIQLKINQQRIQSAA